MDDGKTDGWAAVPLPNRPFFQSFPLGLCRDLFFLLLQHRNKATK